MVNEPPPDKTNKMTMRPAKTQLSLGIPPVWSESRPVWSESFFAVHSMGS